MVLCLFVFAIPPGAGGVLRSLIVALSGDTFIGFLEYFL